MLCDFSFVIHDTKREITLAARDVVGTKPFYYTFDNQSFIYSDDIGELLKNINLVKKPNIESLRSLIESQTISNHETFYKDIKRLPPGHLLIIDKHHTLQIKRYWKPEEIKVDTSISEKEAKEKFLELFEHAISRRVEDLSETFFELSGGLDSSSIVSYASGLYRDGPLHTISMRFPGLPKCDESSYIDMMKSKYALKMQQVPCEDLDYLNRYTLGYNYKQNPYWPVLFTHTFAFKVIEHLKGHNAKTIITGQGGDQLLSGNLYVLHDYFREMKWFLLYKELVRLHHPLSKLKRYLIAPFFTDKQIEMIRSVYQIIFFRKPKSKEEHKDVQSGDELSKHFARTQMSHWYDLDILTSSFHSLMLDSSVMHVIEKNAGIEYRHPFFDRQLIEFILSLPPKYKYQQGMTKVLLRKAMKGILPEKIRMRKDKAEFSAIIRQQIKAIDLNVLLNEAYLAKTGVIAQEKIDDLVRDYHTGKMSRLAYFWMIINLEYWYRYNFVMSEGEI